MYVADAAKESKPIWDDDTLTRISPDEEEELASSLRGLAFLCKQLTLPTSHSLVSRALGDLPKSAREYTQIIHVIQAELEGKLFLFVPSHVSSYYEWEGIITEGTRIAFPSAYNELREAGNCLAAGLHTACVFHSMRAAEIGVRALGNALGVSFPDKPIEFAEWANILDQAESKITAMKNLQRGTQKDEDLAFYSQAAIQFRFFKDGWRVRAAHGRASFSEAQAKEAIDHVRSFFDVISARLKE